MTVGVRRTSRAFQFRRELYTKLRGAQWPTLPGFTSGPSVGWDPDVFEHISVDRVVADSSEVTSLNPVTRDERITATITIVSEVPGASEDEACDRGEQLSDVVQDLFNELDPFGLEVPAGFDLAGEYLSSLVTRTELNTYPTPSEERGFGVIVEIDVTISADI